MQPVEPIYRAAIFIAATNAPDFPDRYRDTARRFILQGQLPDEYDVIECLHDYLDSARDIMYELQLPAAADLATQMIENLNNVLAATYKKAA